MHFATFPRNFGGHMAEIQEKGRIAASLQEILRLLLQHTRCVEWHGGPAGCLPRFEDCGSQLDKRRNPLPIFFMQMSECKPFRLFPAENRHVMTCSKHTVS